MYSHQCPQIGLNTDLKISTLCHMSWDRLFVKSLNDRSINTNSDIPNHSISHVFAISRHNRNHWIIPSLRAPRKERVRSIDCAVNLSVGKIGRQSHDLLLQLFLEVELPGTNGIAGNDGTVLSGRPFSVNLDMDVDCTIDIKP